MQTTPGFNKLILPLTVLIFLAFALFIERTGITYTITNKPTEFLDYDVEEINSLSDYQNNREKKSLVLYDPEGVSKLRSYDTVVYVLESMKVPYDAIDINRPFQYDLEEYESVIITFTQLSNYENKIDALFDWVEEGGRLLFAIRPEYSRTLLSIQNKIGIEFVDPRLMKTAGVEFLTPFLPGMATRNLGDYFLNHTNLVVTLNSDATLHLISGDDHGAPILWEYDLGDGRIVMINSDQFIEKASRGIVAASYNRLSDVNIYPVINASVYYIDDFPAPIPEGVDEDIFRQFNRDIESFYLNVWWPDMQELQEKYNLVYSTVVIETYEHNLEAPFNYSHDQLDLFKYFGGLILRDGGEIGLHGYNHVPLCKEEDEKNQVLKYPTWDYAREMKDSIRELQAFTMDLYPNQKKQMYVPPSNMLCDQARDWLPDVLPDIRTVASIYLPDYEVPAYVQEFGEAEDGLIEFPRLTSGYSPEEYSQWVTANEIYMHYTFGHFVHPDDVLDGYRSGGRSWLEMREEMDEYLLWVFSSAPEIRNMIASEGAMAVQRYARVIPDYECGQSECRVDLQGFYDEAWFLMHSTKVPTYITSGAITEVSQDLYLIEADVETFLIGFGEQ